MKKLLSSIVIAILTAAITLPASAADEKPAETKTGGAARAIPFRGKIAAVDKESKTVKVGERTFRITTDTKIMKAGKPATLDDAGVGEEVGGAYREGDDKQLNVVSLRVGPRPETAPKQENKK